MARVRSALRAGTPALALMLAVGLAAGPAAADHDEDDADDGLGGLLGGLLGEDEDLEPSRKGGKWRRGTTEGLVPPAPEPAPLHPLPLLGEPPPPEPVLLAPDPAPAIVQAPDDPGGGALPSTLSAAGGVAKAVARHLLAIGGVAMLVALALLATGRRP